MPVRAGISIAYPGYPYVAVAAFMATATCVFQEQLRQKAMQARPVQGLIRHGFFTLRLTRPVTEPYGRICPPGSVGGYLLCRTGVVQPCARLWQYPEVVFQDAAQIFCSIRMGFSACGLWGNTSFQSCWPFISACTAHACGRGLQA